MKLSCEEFSQFIDAYLDYELATGERRLFDAHLAHCSDCRDQFEEHAWLQNAVRQGLRRPVQCPDELKASIYKALEREQAPRRVQRALRWAPLPVAVAACVFFFISTTGFRPSVVEDVVAQHARSYPTEIATYKALEMDRWFAERLPFSIESPRFAQAMLLGGRLSQLSTQRHGQQPAAYLIYGFRGRKLSVLAYQERAPDWLALPPLRGHPAEPLRLLDARGYRVLFYQRGETTYVVTSDLPSEELISMGSRELRRAP